MLLTPDHEAALIALVRKVAKAEIMPRFRSLPEDNVSSKSAPDDLVTIADIRSEAAITEGVHAMLPHAVVIGEEAVANDAAVLDRLADAELAVIVDPVDGTWNFAKGLATFGVILAVIENGRTVFGLLYDPVMDDWVWTREGGGTWYQRLGAEPVRLKIGGDMPLETTTGFVPLFLFPTETRTKLAGAIPGYRRIWSVRCSCHEYRLMTHGQSDFCIGVSPLNPWDHAAGVLAVLEAGGAAGMMDGREYAPTHRDGGHLVTARSNLLLDQIRVTLGPLIE